MVSGNSASTREIILGTEDGQIYEMAVDEKDKKEKYLKLLFELTELPEAFMGLQVVLYIGVWCFCRAHVTSPNWITLMVPIPRLN